MRTLLDAGSPPEALIGALEVLRDTPTSTALVEEGHSSGAVLMEDHERYSEKALRVRALLLSLRPCVRLKRQDRAIAGIGQTLASLGAKQPPGSEAGTCSFAAGCMSR